MTTDLEHRMDIDLEEELPRRERRRLMTPAGIAAAAIAIAALGFVAGVQVQKSRADEAPAGRMAGAGGFPGAAGARQGGAGGGQQQSGATVGEVSSVDGSTIYVDDSSGNTLRVQLGKGGKVTRTAVEHADEIHPGDTVVVQGETRSSGTVVASSISATASNAQGAALLGGGGFGAPSGGG